MKCPHDDAVLVARSRTGSRSNVGHDQKPHRKKKEHWLMEMFD